MRAFFVRLLCIANVLPLSSTADEKGITVKRKRILLLGSACALAALAASFSLHPLIALLLLLCWGWVGCALLIPNLRRRLGPRSSKAHPLMTILCMAMVLIPLVWTFREPLSGVLSGQIFFASFDRIWAGFTLDQPTIGKWLFWFAFSSVVIPPFVAAARQLSDRSTPAGYWAFTIPAIVLCLCLLSLLTIGYVMLLKYIAAMGFTPKRIYGLAFALCGYIAVMGFLCWTIWPDKEASVFVKDKCSQKIGHH